MSNTMPLVLRLAPAVLLTLSMPAMASGPTTYSGRCAACHQANGAGNTQFPRLNGRVSKIAATPAGRSYLIKVVLFGMFGPVTVDGRKLNGMMPGQGSLSDQDVADVLNHIASLGGGKPKAFTAGEVAAVRGSGKMTATQVGSERAGLASKGLVP